MAQQTKNTKTKNHIQLNKRIKRTFNNFLSLLRPGILDLDITNKIAGNSLETNKRFLIPLKNKGNQSNSNSPSLNMDLQNLIQSRNDT